MKKYLVILIITVTCLVNDTKVFAQEAFVGGEITARYIGGASSACGGMLPYRFTLRLFRDDPGPGGVAFAGVRRISVFKVDDMGNLSNKVTGQDIVLDDFTVVSTIPTPCLVSPTAVTDGAIYSHVTPVMLEANSNYIMIFGNERQIGLPNFNIGLDFNSPNNNNLKPGTRFTLSSSIRTTDCKAIITDDDDNPVNESVVVNYGRNSMPQWITNGTFEIVQSLCDGNDYTFNLNNYVFDQDQTVYTFFDVNGTPIRTETVLDELEFDIVSVQSGYPKGIPGNTYVNDRSGGDPFPTTFEDPYTWDAATGELTFTPELPNGQTFYTAALTIRTTEYRKGYRLEPIGVTTTDSIRVVERKRLSTTDRQIRFIIGDVSKCNSNLPEYSAAKRNAADDAWEFDCGSDTLFFTMDDPMLASTVSATAPFDLRIFRGTDPSVSKDQDAQAIREIYVDPEKINTLGEFTEFGVVLHEAIGPGRYVMFFKEGDDNNTWGNLCGEFQEELDTTAIFTVNQVYKPYVFKEDDDFRTPGSQKDFCYPSDEDGFFIDALFGQRRDIINRADSFVFKYRGPFSAQAPARETWIQEGPRDSAKFDALPTVIIPSDYSFPTVPLGTPTEGWWTVGIGIEYSYPFQDSTITRRCYGESPTFVDYVEHPRVKTADIDICGDDDFPVLKDFVDEQFQVYNPVGPYSPIRYDWSQQTFTRSGRAITDSIRVGGSVDADSIFLAGSFPNDSLVLEDKAAIGLGLINKVWLDVTFPNGCVSSNEITVVKQRVEVNIQEVPIRSGTTTKDTVLCENVGFNLSNSKEDEYYRQDYMSRQWYFNNQILEGDTNPTLPRAEMIKNGRGWYKLVVTKTTENSVCEGSDSVLIRIADNLEKTDPACSIVTFKDGDVNQRFFWPVVDGADNYQVRPVDGDDNPLNNDGERIQEVEWYEPNDTYGIHHWVKGKEVRLYVRAFNNEVDESAPCRYGEAGLAEACEIRVKPVNIFTPNGDGINDFLRFDLLEIFLGSELTVFNRWGKEVFKSANYQNNWDGGDLKDGTYFYILDIDDPSGMQDIFKGTFTIVR